MQPSSSSGHRDGKGSGSGSEDEDGMEMWRALHDLLDDSDFAVYFTSHGEATLSAGRAVADEWSRIRTLQFISANQLLPLTIEEEREGKRARKRARYLEDNPV